MVFIIFCSLGIYVNIKFLFEVARIRPCGTPSDREHIVRTITLYAVLSFVFNMWLLGRLVQFLFTVKLCTAILSVTIITILLIIFGIVYKTKTC